MSQRTGLAPSTIAAIVRQLLSEQLIEETLPRVGRSGRGRPVARLTPLRPPGHLLGLDFGHAHITAAVASTDENVIVSRTVKWDVDASCANAMDRASELVKAVLDTAGVAESSVRSTVAGIPGPIDRTSGRIQSATILRGWTGMQPREELAARFGGDIRVANDSDLGAWAEHVRGAAVGVDNLVRVHASHGTGAGFVLGGALFSGGFGAAGEIGHTQVPGAADQCRCGQRGCLESVISVTEIRRQLSQAGFPDPGSAAPVTFADVAADPVAARILAEAGRHLGRVLADLCNALDPELLVIGGELATGGESVISGVRESLWRFSQPSVSSRLQVRSSPLGPDAQIIGALAIAGQIAAGQRPRGVSS